MAGKQIGCRYIESEILINFCFHLYLLLSIFVDLDTDKAAKKFEFKSQVVKNMLRAKL